MKNKIPVERTIYSNYNLWETYPDEDMIEELIENGEDRKNISDEDIWKYRYLCDEVDWIETKISLKKFFEEGNKWILFGAVGRWNGVYRAGTIFETLEEFWYKATAYCDYWHIYDENGHLYLRCTHHDGTCHYEIKELTDKGIQYLENWGYGNDDRTEEYVHTQIFNKYSRLPRFAEKVYGCKRFEYEPITKEKLINKLRNEAKSFYC